MAKLPVELRHALLEDLAHDKPTPSRWSTWVDAQAEKYEAKPRDVQLFYTQHLEYLEIQTQIAAIPTAQKLAATLGATRAKALQTLERVLKATRIRYVKVVGGEAGQMEEVTEPDWRVRKDAAVDILKVWGSFAPQEVVVRHSITEQFKTLTDEQIEEKMQLLIAASNEPELPNTDVRPN